MQTTLNILKALADRNRIRIVAALWHQEELCACQITELLQVTGATASRHLGILQKAGLVGSRKDGRWVHYFLADPDGSEPLSHWLKQETLGTDDLRADAVALARITRISPEELCRLQRGESCCPE